MKEDMKIFVLSDGSKWLTISSINYNDDTYKYMLGVKDNEEDITEESKVMREYIDKGKKYMEIVNDSNLLKTVIPLLMPGTKEYIDNPEKIQELIKEN